MLLVRVHQLIYSWSDKNISTWQISTSGVCSYSKYEPWIKFRGSDILIIFVFVRLVHISCYMPPGKQTKDNMPVVHPTFSGNSSLLLGGSGATPVQHFTIVSIPGVRPKSCSALHWLAVVLFVLPSIALYSS